MEWTRIRRRASNHNREIKYSAKASEADEDVRDGGVYEPHVLAESAGKKEDSGVEHPRKTLYEEVERPFLKPIAFELTITATFDRRPARISQVPVYPLLPQHGEECNEQGNRKTRVHEPGRGDDPTWWILLNRGDDGDLAGDNGLIKGEEDRTKEGGGLFVWIGLEFRMDVKDES